MQVVKTFANTAATNNEAKDGYVAILSGVGVTVATAITDKAVGIFTKGGDATLLQSDVCIFGECRAILGGTVVAGARVQPHTDGTLVTTAASSSTECGIALEGGVAGDWINVFVIPPIVKY
jgi:hypothetical protein